MPRFDRSRARLLDLSDAFPSHGGLPSHPRSRYALDLQIAKFNILHAPPGSPCRILAFYLLSDLCNSML